MQFGIDVQRWLSLCWFLALLGGVWGLVCDWLSTSFVYFAHIKLTNQNKWVLLVLRLLHYGHLGLLSLVSKCCLGCNINLSETTWNSTHRMILWRKGCGLLWLFFVSWCHFGRIVFVSRDWIWLSIWSLFRMHAGFFLFFDFSRLLHLLREFFGYNRSSRLFLTLLLIHFNAPNREFYFHFPSKVYLLLYSSIYIHTCHSCYQCTEKSL